MIRRNDDAKNSGKKPSHYHKSLFTFLLSVLAFSSERFLICNATDNECCVGQCMIPSLDYLLGARKCPSKKVKKKLKKVEVTNFGHLFGSNLFAHKICFIVIVISIQFR